jgi:hypothetical protein
VRDPRHMYATLTFAGWPAVALHLSHRVRLDLAAATADLLTLLVFALPNELDETGIARLLAELRGDGRGERRPAEPNAGRRAVLWLLRGGAYAWGWSKRCDASELPFRK